MISLTNTHTHTLIYMGRTTYILYVNLKFSLYYNWFYCAHAKTMQCSLIFMHSLPFAFLPLSTMSEYLKLSAGKDAAAVAVAFKSGPA